MPGRPRPSSSPELEPLLDSRQVADLLRVPPRTLDRWAYVGSGPPYLRLGRHRRYDPADLRAWLDGHRRATNGNEA